MSRAWILGLAAVIAAISALPAVGRYVLDGKEAHALLRVDVQYASPKGTSSRRLVVALGGPVYCDQVAALSRFLRASVLCPDYGRDGERSGASRAKRVEDWGDPAYLAAVARLARRMVAGGRERSQLILVGASYAGYAAAELAATHPELRPRALIVVDSFLDLRARFRALAPGQATRAEMIQVLGGTPAQHPLAYRRRSPSAHLAGLASAIRHGMRFVDVWSVGAKEAREFSGAMCQRRANAFWLRRLSRLLHRPVTGYVTHLQHARALWDWWRQLLALAGLTTTRYPLPAAAYRFRAGEAIHAGSYCRAG